MTKLIKVIDNQTIELISYRNPNICFNIEDTTYIKDEGIPGELKTSLFKDCEYYCDFKKQINPFELYNDYEKQQQEIDRLNKIIDTILDFSFFQEECPLCIDFNDKNEDKSQLIFYNEGYCEKECCNDYKKCWLKYFKRLQELKEEGK